VPCTALGIHCNLWLHPQLLQFVQAKWTNVNVLSWLLSQIQQYRQTEPRLYDAVIVRAFVHPDVILLVAEENTFVFFVEEAAFIRRVVAPMFVERR
jgi:hypothetical protein